MDLQTKTTTALQIRSLIKLGLKNGGTQRQLMSFADYGQGHHVFLDRYGHH